MIWKGCVCGGEGGGRGGRGGGEEGGLSHLEYTRLCVIPLLSQPSKINLNQLDLNSKVSS